MENKTKNYTYENKHFNHQNKGNIDKNGNDKEVLDYYSDIRNNNQKEEQNFVKRDSKDILEEIILNSELNEGGLTQSLQNILLDKDFASPVIMEKENRLISNYHYVTFKNAYGENSCFINVILHILYYFEKLDDYLVSLYQLDKSKVGKENNINEKNKFLALLGKVLCKYEVTITEENDAAKKFRNRNQVTIVNTLNMRKVLASASSNQFPLNTIADPVELLNFIFDLLNENLKEGLHECFYLELIDEFLCKSIKNCQINIKNEYDKDNFIYHIYIDEILKYIEKKNLKVNNYKNKLFELSYKMFLSENVKICEKCKEEMNHNLVCKNSPEYLLINCVWKESNPIVDDVISFFFLISLKDELNNLFTCNKPRKKGENSYYLLGFILYSFTLSHYIVCLYNYEKELFFIIDDEVVKEYRNLYELIVDITVNILKLNDKAFFYPVMLIFTKGELFNNKVIKTNTLNDSEYSTIINKCNEAIYECQMQNNINEEEKLNNYQDYIEKQKEIENKILKRRDRKINRYEGNQKQRENNENYINNKKNNEKEKKIEVNNGREKKIEVNNGREEYNEKEKKIEMNNDRGKKIKVNNGGEVCNEKEKQIEDNNDKDKKIKVNNGKELYNGKEKQIEINNDKEKTTEINNDKYKKIEPNNEREIKIRLNNDKDKNFEKDNERDTKIEINNDKDKKIELSNEKKSKFELNNDNGMNNKKIEINDKKTRNEKENIKIKNDENEVNNNEINDNKKYNKNIKEQKAQNEKEILNKDKNEKDILNSQWRQERNNRKNEYIENKYNKENKEKNLEINENIEKNKMKSVLNEKNQKKIGQILKDINKKEEQNFSKENFRNINNNTYNKKENAYKNIEIKENDAYNNKTEIKNNYSNMGRRNKSYISQSTIDKDNKEEKENNKETFIYRRINNIADNSGYQYNSKNQRKNENLSNKRDNNILDNNKNNNNNNVNVNINTNIGNRRRGRDSFQSQIHWNNNKLEKNDKIKENNNNQEINRIKNNIEEKCVRKNNNFNKETIYTKSKNNNSNTPKKERFHNYTYQNFNNEGQKENIYDKNDNNKYTFRSEKKRNIYKSQFAFQNKDNDARNIVKNGEEEDNNHKFNHSNYWSNNQKNIRSQYNTRTNKH